jgi:hypothetical protein
VKRTNLPFEPQVHEEKIWYKVHKKDELGRTVLHYIAGGLTDNRGAYYEGASNVALKRLVFMEADVDAEDVHVSHAKYT